jgi:lysophospholipase L1-like esterase
MSVSLKKSIVASLVIALAACSGGGGGTNAIPAAASQKTAPVKPASGDAILARIVGVGDSLTAGYIAQGFLGQRGVKIKEPSASGGSTLVSIPETQENGWWADLDEEASGLPLQQAIAREYNPAISPLPLIKGPGLNNQIIPLALGAAESKGSNSCNAFGGFDAAGFVLSGLPRVRMNPSSTTIRNVAVPGITAHEANVLSAPQTSTCEPIPGVPGLLNQVVADESSVFWPVLGGFAKMGSNLTMVRAAASLHPTLATVWIGANDVLKYMGSGGRFVGGDNTVAQVSGDVKATIQTLQYAGARVVVANLPNVLLTPYFMSVAPPPDASTLGCIEPTLEANAYCILLNSNGLTNLEAPTAIKELTTQYHLGNGKGCSPTSLTKPCGFITVQGVLEIVQYASTPATKGQLPNLDCAVPAPKCTPIPGNGLGANYITPEFAAKVQALNNIVNAGIGEAAQSTGAPLVDVEKIFDGIASGNTSDPYYRIARSINPGIGCCTLGYYLPPFTNGGLVGLDGLHPSNTGYALLANAFITTINQRYGTHIPIVDIKAVYNGTRCSTYCVKDPYAPH